MSYLDKIYAPWNGNAEEMAAAIGELGVTVRQWRNRGRIREVHWRKIIAAAAARGHTLTAEDFLPHEEGRTDHAPADTSAAQHASHGKGGEVSASQVAA